MDLNEAKRILVQGWRDELIEALEWAIAEIERLTMLGNPIPTGMTLAEVRKLKIDVQSLIAHAPDELRYSAMLSDATASAAIAAEADADGTGSRVEEVQ